MVSVFYASLLAFLICWLSLRVIKSRRANKVKYADGGVEDLQIARTAHSNAVEYIPIILILLFGLEYNGAPLWMVHVFGLATLAGRVIHAHGILSVRLKGRVLGMQITIFTIIGLGAVNLLFLPYDTLI